MTSPRTPHPLPRPLSTSSTSDHPSRSVASVGPRVYDVVIIGGGAAGLSAAVVLGRARRSVIVIDGGEPRNAPAAGVHSYLTRDGVNPLELVRLGQDEARSYGVEIVTGQAVDTLRTTRGLQVTLHSGAVVTGRRLVVATGLVDELPDLPGLADRWGRDVLHCPYCHGWEVRDQAIGILGTGPKSVHQALLFSQWSDEVTLFLHRDMLGVDGRLDDQHGPTETEWEQLAARGISVVIGPVESVLVQEDSLRGVRLASGQVIPVRALVVAPTFTARTAFLAGLGVISTPHPLGVGTQLRTDESGRVLNGEAIVPGLWAAGNVDNLMAQVVVSAAAGLSVATSINTDLLAEELAADVERYRHPFSVDAESLNTVAVLGDRRHGIEGHDHTGAVPAQAQPRPEPSARALPRQGQHQ